MRRQLPLDTNHWDNKNGPGHSLSSSPIHSWSDTSGHNLHRHTQEFDDSLSDIEEELWRLDQSLANRNINHQGDMVHSSVIHTYQSDSKLSTQGLYAYSSSSPVRNLPASNVPSSTTESGDGNAFAADNSSLLFETRHPVKVRCGSPFPDITRVARRKSEVLQGLNLSHEANNYC